MDKGSYKSLTTQDGTAFSEPGPSSQDCTIPNSSTSRSTTGRLCEAIMLSDKNEVQRLLEKLKSGKVNMEDCYTEGILPRPMTIIHIAAKKQDKKYLELLLQSEVFNDVNTKDGLGYTPLMHAADAGRIENVRLLIQENADISAESKSRSEGADVRLLVQSEANKSADRKPDRSLQKCLKRTVFHIAAGRGHKDIIEELFKNRNREDIGRIVNQEDDNGWTPLFWAAQSRDLECFNLLLGTELCKKTEDKLKRNIFHIIAENDCHEMN
ncbi:serine/threonine-protein phosphatase 6 regulatory ankyrin repeat subunit A-like [Anabrus simplex]|uniref:serine/threonine-protein phosphatase 6 regulatory ankyrin repeat subunit A-like n=1 Tax=Anabrus simplex TaxID=316456 RepID=UPI0035A33CB6